MKTNTNMGKIKRWCQRRIVAKAYSNSSAACTDFKVASSSFHVRVSSISLSKLKRRFDFRRSSLFRLWVALRWDLDSKIMQNLSKDSAAL